MRRLLPSTRLPVKTGCTCHDPTVFGHLTCRSETQPNPTPPRPPDTSHVTRISTTTLTELSVSCGIIEANMNTLNQITEETARRIDQLTALVDYLEGRTTNPPPHG